MPPTVNIHTGSTGVNARFNLRKLPSPPWRRRVDHAIVKLTNTQTSNALYATIFCLALGLVFVLVNALGAQMPAPRHDDLGRDVASAAARTGHGAAEDAEAPPQGPARRRLAIVIPYLPPTDGAPALPPFFDLFAASAAGSAAAVDFLLFHCFVPASALPAPGALPANVRLIDLNEPGGECGLARLFARVTDRRQEARTMATPLERLLPRLSRQIVDLPYILVEYKPAFGHIFAEYLEEYSHWGYSDLDIVFGDLPRWIDEDEWRDYDIVTYGFGDQDKLYLRGQLTFHKNDPARVNQVWRHCKYLSEMDVRYARPDRLKFESAEGCYSQAVIARKDLRVKWAVKAFTDVGEGGPIYTQGVYLSLGSPPSLTSSRSYQPKSVLYTAVTAAAGRQLIGLPPDWFEDKKKYPKYAEGLPIQKVVGEKSLVETYRMLFARGDEKAAKVKCMYWAPKTYQMDICTVDGTVASDEVVTLEEGVLYKQKFVERKKMFPEGIRSFPFFHFQEWKRIYRTTQLLPTHNVRQSDAAGLIITKEGALPLFAPASSGWQFRHGRPWSSSASSAWTAADTGATTSRPSAARFCLGSASKKRPAGATACAATASWPRPGAAAPEDAAAAVTVVRSPARVATAKGILRGRKTGATPASWWDEKSVDAGSDVTLALTLQITSAHMQEKQAVQNLLAMGDSNLYVWGHQPSVLLIHVDSSQNERDDDIFTETIQMIKDTFAPNGMTASTAHLENTLVAIVRSDGPKVSRKGLMNMAASAAPTRWLLSGLELERGLVLSREASLYAGRAAKVHADITGHVLVLPQFASTRDDERDGDEKHWYPQDRLIHSSVGAGSLPSIRGKQTMVSNLSGYDCVPCKYEHADDGVDGATEPDQRRLTDASSSSAEKNADELLADLWWDLSVAEVFGTPGGFNGKVDASLDAMARIHDRIEVALASLLEPKTEHADFLRYFDKSPILLIDRLGPKKDMLTLDLAPEVEDFGGRACFHLLRLAQLAALGYKVGVLPGAFAASYPKTRAALCTDSIRESISPECNCDLDSEGTIKEILMDEVKRTGKVAVLMKEFDATLLNSR